MSRKFHPQFKMLPIALGIATLSLGSVAVYAADTSGIEEVIVTARKTEESVQVVPVSVTALSTASLEKQAVLSVQDLRTSVPGLFVAANSQGGAPTFAIRAAKADNGTSDTVTAYIDDMPVASTISVGNMVYDMQSISVLKGPQGTLFGANSTGGAIVFRPNRPSDKFEGYAEVGVGNFGRQQFQGMINLPVNDMLQLRLAGETVKRDGFVHNRGPDGGDLSDDDHQSLRFSARLKPGGGWQHDLLLDYFNKDNKPLQAIPTAIRPRYNYQTFLGFALPVDYARAGGVVVGDPKNVAIGGAPVYAKAKIWDAIYTLQYEINDQASFKTVVGYQNNELKTAEDNDSTPYRVVNIINQNKYEQWTFEPSIDLKSADGRLRNKTGLFISEKKMQQGGGGMVLGLPFDLTGVPAAAIVPNFYGLDSASFYWRNFKSHAVYTQFSYDLSKELTATFGLRYTWDRADYKATNRTYLGTPATTRNIPLAIGGNFFPAPLGGCSASLAFYPSYDAASCMAGAAVKSQAPSFTFTLEDKFAERSMIYATMRGGYLVGGFNNNVNPPATGMPVTFKPEKVVDFETGLKSDWELWGRPIRTNLAVFYSTYKDQQRVQNGTTPNGTTFIGVANAGAATAYGLDLDVTYEPTDNLTLTASWNHIESEYTKFNAIVNIPGRFAYVDLSGKPMSQTPKDVVNLSATAKWPLSSGVGAVSSTLSWFWTDKTTHHDSPTFNCNSDASGLCTSIVAGQDFTEYDLLPGYDLWNFSTQWKNIMGSNFDANFWVKNLTDKKYKTYGGNQMLSFGYAAFNFGNPREIGLNVRYNF